VSSQNGDRELRQRLVRVLRGLHGAVITACHLDHGVYRGIIDGVKILFRPRRRHVDGEVNDVAWAVAAKSRFYAPRARNGSCSAF
jgi:hypothetical protein